MAGEPRDGDTVRMGTGRCEGAVPDGIRSGGSPEDKGVPETEEHHHSRTAEVRTEGSSGSKDGCGGDIGIVELGGEFQAVLRHRESADKRDGDVSYGGIGGKKDGPCDV